MLKITKAVNLNLDSDFKPSNLIFLKIKYRALIYDPLEYQIAKIFFRFPNSLDIHYSSMNNNAIFNITYNSLFRVQIPNRK